MTMQTQDKSAPAPTPVETAGVLAVASIIMSMGLAAIGNGLMFAYIPVRLGSAGFDPIWAGAILTGLSGGGLIGCLVTGRLVRRVGHARAFMVFSAIIVLSNASIGTGTYPALWIASRALYGFAICSMFIVSQSWLNDVVDNFVRGRVMAIFYVTYVVGMGFGSFLMGVIDIEGPTAPLIGIAFTALSILPIGLTRLAPPPPPENASLAFAKAWSVSPVGMLTVGGLSMLIAGFTPIHATASGYGQGQIALLMFAMPLGTVLFQIPFGWISDRTDRRYVMIAASALVVVAGLLALGFDGASISLVIAIYIVWSGAAESIYSLSSAHANDRADKADLVALSSTMLFAWSLSGFVVPGVGTVLTGLYGTHAFMYIAVVLAAVFAAFVTWRIMQADAVPLDETGSFAPMPAQAPLPVELAFAAEPDDSGSDVGDGPGIR